MTVERLLRLALGAVREGLPLQQSLLYSQDEDIWLAAVHAFVMAMPDMDTRVLGEWLRGASQEDVIATLERAITEVSNA